MLQNLSPEVLEIIFSFLDNYTLVALTYDKIIGYFVYKYLQNKHGNEIKLIIKQNLMAEIKFSNNSIEYFKFKRIDSGVILMKWTFCLNGNYHEIIDNRLGKKNRRVREYSSISSDFPIRETQYINNKPYVIRITNPETAPRLKYCDWCQINEREELKKEFVEHLLSLDFFGEGEVICRDCIEKLY